MLLGAGRLCTGLVYGNDENATYLVIKPPGWSYYRQASWTAPVPRHGILDQDEPGLFYEGVYFSLMKAAPWAMLACLLAAGAGVAARQTRHS